MKIKKDEDRTVIVNLECDLIVKDLFRIISCEIHDIDNRNRAIKLLKRLCTDKWDDVKE